MVKTLTIILLAMASLACAKEFKIEVQFSPMFWLSGKRHNDTMTFRHDGRRIICHCRPLTIQERKWIADNATHSYPAMYSESAYIDGVGKILMLAHEEIHANNETCVRGIVYLIHDNGKWEQGVFSQRTLGWGDSDSKIWGGYAFAHSKEENLKKTRGEE